ADMHPSIAKRFGPLMSPSSTNDTELYGEPVDGVFRSAPSALFPSQVNRLLAESFLERRQPSTSFMTKIAAAILPYFDAVVAAAPLFHL
ncbi:hypothetical protein, partial [Escherichia coli]|uniref:hypothetical protein n=1 Tax=Escherichia coli TaxID=562 RepID=UPI0027098844